MEEALNDFEGFGEAVGFFGGPGPRVGLWHQIPLTVSWDNARIADFLLFMGYLGHLGLIWPYKPLGLNGVQE